MCGIMGVYPQTQNSSMLLPFLAWEMEKRGDDSWGCTDGNVIVRKVGPITDSFEMLPRAKSVIYHTRRATIGAISEENTHPFKFEGDIGTIVGIHNGIVINHRQLNTDYGRSFDVDSMHIFKHMSDRLDMTDIEAWGVILWYDKDKELSLCKISQNADISIMRLESGEIIFCSESSAIKRAAKMTMNRIVGEWRGLEPNTIYHFSTEEDRPIIVEGNRLEFKKYETVNYRDNYCRAGINPRLVSSNPGIINNSNIHNRWQEDLCRTCQEQKVFVGKELLCRECFVKVKNIVAARKVTSNSNTPAILPSSYINSGNSN